MRVSVFIATSLDGFIAGMDGDLKWLNEASAEVPEGDDLGYAEFMASVDTLVMGRKTYEQVLSFGAWPYGDKPVIVLSHNPLVFPEYIPDTVSHSSESPTDLYRRLAEAGSKHIYVDGGNTIQRFMAVGLITDITLTLVPVFLGSGIPLIHELDQQIHLKHMQSRTSENGFVQVRYELIEST